MNTLRLLLRSVYLKGQQDGRNKTCDMSWEDKIIKDIAKVRLAELPKRKNDTDNLSPSFIAGFNACHDEAVKKIKEIK